MVLTLILGPMFSGKTTELILQASRVFSRNSKKILLVLCSLDTRDLQNQISTHFKYFTNLHDLFDIITLKPEEFLPENIPSSYETICIDEAQFFRNLVETLEILNRDKKIICAGLKANYQKKAFGEILNLVALADEIILKKSLCHYCPNEAVHTRRKVKSDQEIEIGGGDIYEPVCFEHYN